MRVIFILSICLFFASCGKKRTIVITATNGATGERYVGLQYSVVSTLISATDGKSTKTVASGVLDVNGEASFQLRAKQGRTYAVRVVAPENNCYNENSTIFFGSPNDKNGHFDFVFAPCAYLTLSVNNINCQGASDKILFDMQPEYIPNYNNITPTEKLGCYANTFIESQVPFGSWKATWEVTRNGITTYHDSIFFIEKNEHYTFTINY